MNQRNASVATTNLLRGEVARLGLEVSTLKDTLQKEISCRKQAESELFSTKSELRAKLTENDNLSFENSRISARLKQVLSQFEHETRDNENSLRKGSTFFGSFLNSATGTTGEIERLERLVKVLENDLQHRINDAKDAHMLLTEEREKYKLSEANLQAKLQQYEHQLQQKDTKESNMKKQIGEQFMQLKEYENTIKHLQSLSSVWESTCLDFACAIVGNYPNCGENVLLDEVTLDVEHRKPKQYGIRWSMGTIHRAIVTLTEQAGNPLRDAFQLLGKRLQTLSVMYESVSSWNSKDKENWVSIVEEIVGNCLDIEHHQKQQLQQEPVPKAQESLRQIGHLLQRIGNETDNDTTELRQLTHEFGMLLAEQSTNSLSLQNIQISEEDSMTRIRTQLVYYIIGNFLQVLAQGEASQTASEAQTKKEAPNGESLILNDENSDPCLAERIDKLIAENNELKARLDEAEIKLHRSRAEPKEQIVQRTRIGVGSTDFGTSVGFPPGVLEDLETHIAQQERIVELSTKLEVVDARYLKLYEAYKQAVVKITSLAEDHKRHNRQKSLWKSAMKEAREELEGTRQGYANQMKVITEKVCSLEQELSVKTSEAARLQLLVKQMRKDTIESQKAIDERNPFSHME